MSEGATFAWQGCRAECDCPKCHAHMVCDSSRAGTTDGEIWFIHGPCCCIMPVCPACGFRSIGPAAPAATSLPFDGVFVGRDKPVAYLVLWRDEEGGGLVTAVKNGIVAPVVIADGEKPTVFPTEEAASEAIRASLELHKWGEDRCSVLPIFIGR